MSDPKIDLEGTYWFHAGKSQALADELAKIVPDEGEVANADLNHALENFRVASNCYYDLYNNGLCNRSREFREVFGFHADPSLDADDDAPADEYMENLDQRQVQRIERRMTAIIAAAAKEQGLVATNGAK